MSCAKFNNIPSFRVELTINVRPASEVRRENHRFNLWLRYHDEKHMVTVYQLWCHTYANGPQSNDIEMNINIEADEIRYIGAELPEPILHQATDEELEYIALATAHLHLLYSVSASLLLYRIS